MKKTNTNVTIITKEGLYTFRSPESLIVTDNGKIVYRIDKVLEQPEPYDNGEPKDQNWKSDLEEELKRKA